MSRSGPYRLAQGGQIDRSKEILFWFNGRHYRGYAGDTLASALLANGVRTVGRSFKFHRPRGIFSSGIEEPNALVSLGRGARAVPSERAPVVELTHGLEAASQKGWPTVTFDLGRALDCVAPFWSAGFYNKTFIWPRWHPYEGVIRKLAGLGHAPTERDPDRYEVQNLHCDVLVVGAGRTGLWAALDSARAGARVVLIEQEQVLGGHAAWGGSTIGPFAADRWNSDTVAELARLPDVRIFTRTTAVGYYDHDVVMLLERVPLSKEGVRERLWIVRARRVVLATGTIEQPLIFDHNDRPGIQLALAMREYLKRYGVAPGRRALIATNNDSAYALATDLHEAGIEVVAVTDTRTQVPEALRLALQSRHIAFLPRSIPTDTAGFSHLKAVTVGRLSPDTRHVEAVERFRCDGLAVSGGFSPALQLFAQAGGKLRYDEASGALRAEAFSPTSRHAAVEVVGSATRAIPAGLRVSPVGRSSRKWVDLLHDVTVSDLELALRENFTAVEHVKRHTTVGMAPDQGKTTAAPTLDVLSRLRGVRASELGHTTFRPPVTPVTLGALVGRESGQRFAPKRLLPMHAWHVKHGAVLQDFGGWQRPVAYLRSGETREQAIHREALAVRTQAGLFDGSSLGKIEVIGPDALEFLDRFYINNLKTLTPGRVRYGLMLKETGILFDDGTVVMRAPDHVILTTTSGNAGRVLQWLEEWHQCEWPDLNVAIVPVTEQWATLSLAGPLARDILSRLDSTLDLSNAAFPHLSLREGVLLGVPARIYRVSFTGELTYEINVPADAALRIWETLLDVGVAQGLQPFGLDALQNLRLEKGFLHIGSDTDGTTIPDDVGWGMVAANKTADYIGKRSLRLPEHVRSDRLQLVGLQAVSTEPPPNRSGPKSNLRCAGAAHALGLSALYAPEVHGAHPATASRLVVGSHLRGELTVNATEGWITSAGHTVLGDVPVALALLRAGRHRVGSEVTVLVDGKQVSRARVVKLPFYNPGGERMNA